MTTFKEDSAFPIPNTAIDHTEGLSKREYFAAQALTGYLAAHAGEGITLPDPITAAQQMVIYADELIVALNQQQSIAALTEN